MAVTLIFNHWGFEESKTFYTRAGIEHWVKRNGTMCLIDVKGSLPFLPKQKNVAAEIDWLDRMGGTCEFDLDEVEALLRRNDDEWYF